VKGSDRGLFQGNIPAYAWNRVGVYRPRFKLGTSRIRKCVNSYKAWVNDLWITIVIL